jgi:lipid A 3-O-deacylase
MVRSFAIAIAVLCSATAAGAADLYIDNPAGLKDPVDSGGWVEKYVSEVRLGGMYHDAGVFGTRKEKGEDVNAEILFTSPNFLASIWAPRPHLGTTINTVGDTSQVYAGLTWSFNLWKSLFLELSEGGSLNNGNLDKRDPNRKDLGSNVLFRESASLGWKFDDHNSLSIMLDHISNAGLAKYNGGMETVGLRYGYHF